MPTIRIDIPPSAAPPSPSGGSVAVRIVATSAFLFLAAMTLLEVAPWSVAPYKEGAVTILCDEGGPAPPGVVTAARATLLSDATIAAAANAFVERALGDGISTSSGTELARAVRHSISVELPAAGSASPELLTVRFRGRQPEGLDLLERLARMVARELVPRLSEEAARKVAELRASREAVQEDIAALGAKLDGCDAEIAQLHTSLRDARRESWRRANAATDDSSMVADGDAREQRSGTATRLVNLLIDRSAHLAALGAASRRSQRLGTQLPAAEAALREIPKLRLAATPLQQTARQVWREQLAFALAIAVAICGGLWCSLDAARSSRPAANAARRAQADNPHAPALSIGPHVGRELAARLRPRGPRAHIDSYAESSGVTGSMPAPSPASDA